MLAGQLIPRARPGIKIGIRLPLGIDQHLALGRADIDIEQVGHHPFVELPCLQITLGIVQVWAADIFHLHLVVDKRKLPFHLLKIGLDEDVTQLVIGGEQTLLQLVLQAAFHVQIVDAAQHQYGNEQQQQPQPHPGNQGPGFLGDNTLIQP
jgi:hypothetical protein